MTVRSSARLASNLYQGANVPKSDHAPAPLSISLDGAGAPLNGLPFEAVRQSFSITP